jgi:hypothetical protein
MHTDLWNYALALYARPGVEAACLNCRRWVAMSACCCARPGCKHVVWPYWANAQALQNLPSPGSVTWSPLRSLRQQWRAQHR